MPPPTSGRSRARDATKADSELTDVRVAFKTTNTGAAEEQNGLIREALDRDEADAIAISVIDPAGQKKVINDAARRALVITQDSDAPDSDRSPYLGADNRAAGRQAGELIKKALPQGGKIMVFVGKREVQNARERFEGLKESLQGSIAARILKGDRSAIPENKTILIPKVIIQKNNVDKYSKNLSQLLGIT